MFCTKCGYELSDSAKKCIRCGAPVAQRRTENASQTASRNTFQQTSTAKNASQNSSSKIVISIIAVALAFIVGKFVIAPFFTDNYLNNSSDKYDGKEITETFELDGDGGAQTIKIISREDGTVIAVLSSATIQDATGMLTFKNQMEQARSDFSGLRNAIFEIDDDGDLYKVKYEFTDLDKSDNEILRYRVAKFFGLSYEEDEMLYYEDLEKSLTDAGYSHS